MMNLLDNAQPSFVAQRPGNSLEYLTAGHVRKRGRGLVIENVSLTVIGVANAKGVFGWKERLAAWFHSAEVIWSCHNLSEREESEKLAHVA